MNLKSNLKSSLKAFATFTFIFGVAAAMAATPAAKPTDGAAATKQKQFDDAKQAADSLAKAAESFDQAALAEILGPDSTDLISSEDPVMDKERATAFAAKAKEKTDLQPLEKDPNRMVMVVGNDADTVPIPIMKEKGKWIFDTKTGREEVLNRRIGANELDAIAICRGFVEAQHEYAQEKHDDAKVNQYAQKVISTQGKKDGLAWQNPDGTWGGPIGEDIAKAIEQGYSKKDQPFHGYFFKVLKGQGPAAPMGEMDFVVGGAMIGGFALAAVPAEYRVTGVKSFLVGPDGVVYEKDLGKDTAKAYEAVERYNPDKTWKATDDDWPSDEEETAPEE